MSERITSTQIVRHVLTGRTDRPGWGEVAIASDHERYMERTVDRRRCACCGNRCTHVGAANGLALITGCELRVRRWVRDGE